MGVCVGFGKGEEMNQMRFWLGMFCGFEMVSSYIQRQWHILAPSSPSFLSGNDPFWDYPTIKTECLSCLGLCRESVSIYNLNLLSAVYM